MIDYFLLAFIPLFVAIDALGIIPIFLSFTKNMPDFEKRRLTLHSTATALILALIFMVVGKTVFSFLGITENDFRIGGGIVLLILSIRDLLDDDSDVSRTPKGEVGVVPIGVPLIMGPGALTTIIMVTDSYGYAMTSISIILNLLIVYLLFSQSKWILMVIGDGGTKAFAKVASLFLAAISVMMIRVGIMNIISS